MKLTPDEEHEAQTWALESRDVKLLRGGRSLAWWYRHRTEKEANKSRERKTA